MVSIFLGGELSAGDVLVVHGWKEGLYDALW